MLNNIPLSRCTIVYVPNYLLKLGHVQVLQLNNVCPEDILPCSMKNGDIYWRRYNIQETLYIEQWCLSHLQSRHLGTSHSSPNCHQLPHCIFLNLIYGLKSLPFQREFILLILFWEKPEVVGHQTGVVGRLCDLGDLMFCQKPLYEIWCVSGRIVALLWWSCQSPVAHGCGLLNHPYSFRGGMYKLNVKFDADSLLYLVILKAMATQ